MEEGEGEAPSEPQAGMTAGSTQGSHSHTAQAQVRRVGTKERFALGAAWDGPTYGRQREETLAAMGAVDAAAEGLDAQAKVNLSTCTVDRTGSVGVHWLVVSTSSLDHPGWMSRSAERVEGGIDMEGSSTAPHKAGLVERCTEDRRSGRCSPVEAELERRHTDRVHRTCH